MLIDAYSLPLRADIVLEAASRTRNLIVTCEDNYAGGFGAAVADAAAAAGGFKVHQCVVTGLPKSAREPEELMAHFGLSSEALAETIEQLVSQPS